MIALGLAQTLAWGSTYYLPAILANAMAAELGLATAWIFTAFSAGLLLSAFLGPAAGRLIDVHGGRRVLPASNLVFAAGLTLLGFSSGPISLFAAWLVIGAGMSAGLYEAAFSTLAGIYGRDARRSITGITLIAGFASTVCWPLSAYMDITIGWRATCYVWAAAHLLIGLPINLMLPPGKAAERAAPAVESQALGKSRLVLMVGLSFVFAATWFCSTAMAAHLPRVLQEAGATLAAAVAAAALVGPAQVGARVLEFWLMRHAHPLVSARIATLAHPVGRGRIAGRRRARGGTLRRDPRRREWRDDHLHGHAAARAVRRRRVRAAPGAADGAGAAVLGERAIPVRPAACPVRNGIAGGDRQPRELPPSSSSS